MLLRFTIIQLISIIMITLTSILLFAPVMLSQIDQSFAITIKSLIDFKVFIFDKTEKKIRLRKKITQLTPFSTTFKIFLICLLTEEILLGCYYVTANFAWNSRWNYVALEKSNFNLICYIKHRKKISF